MTKILRNKTKNKVEDKSSRGCQSGSIVSLREWRSLIISPKDIPSKKDTQVILRNIRYGSK